METPLSYTTEYRRVYNLFYYRQNRDQLIKKTKERIALLPPKVPIPKTKNKQVSVLKMTQVKRPVLKRSRFDKFKCLLNKNNEIILDLCL